MSRAVAELVVFLVGSVLWAAAVSTASTAAGVDLAALDGRQAGWLGAVSLGGLAAFAAARAERPLRDGLALRRPTVAQVGWAAASGATVWLAPTAGVAWVSDRFGLDVSAMAQTSAWIRDGRPDEQLAMLLAVCVAAPLAEEIVFRGYLWRVIGGALGHAGAWLVSTALFVTYHGDPAQALGVIPVATLLGALRWRTGSVWPGIAAHAGNNVGAAVGLFVMPADLAAPPWPIAAAAAVCAVGCAISAARSLTTTDQPQ